MAFSPCFVAPTEPQGSPKLFICHGVADRVLPIDRCSRKIVPWLERAGYAVRYREFDGGHIIPPALVEEAFAWFLA